MSHYAVGVICRDIKDINKALEPFNENMEVDPYVSCTVEGLKNKYNEIVKAIETGESDKYNVEYLQKNKEDYATYESYIKSHYSDREFNEKGELLSTYNPNSKWDYWTIGGRWSDELPLKDGGYADYAKLKDVDFEKRLNDKDEVAEAEERWDKFISGADFIEPQYFIDRYGTKENFVKQTLTFSTYAVLDVDGKWLAPGEMGWFGCSTASDEDKKDFEKNYTDLIKAMDPELYFVVVDCHI